jgi:hypothetical protein
MVGRPISELDVPPEISAWAKLDALTEIFGYDFGRPPGCTKKARRRELSTSPILKDCCALVLPECRESLRRQGGLAGGVLNVTSN